MANAYDPAVQEFWRHVRDQFVLEHPRVNLAASSIAPHSRMVQRAMARHAEGLDTEGFPYLSSELPDNETRMRKATARYFSPGKFENVALTDGTIQGLALLYAGIKIEPKQEILTSTHEFSHVYKCFNSRQEREGRDPAFVRKIDLFDALPTFNPDTVVERIKNALRENTRVLALTWVYSNTGVKLPISKIGEVVRQWNLGRAPERQVLFCVDGVHGFGVEDTTFPELQCDFFVSGCHKWVFGPRGTGVWLGTDEAWTQMHLPLIPSMTGSKTAALAHTPGGLHSYELRWALDEAFEFLERRVGKCRIQDRVHGTAKRVKQALLSMKHVGLVTPESPDHSAGLVCFDVLDGKSEPVQVGGPLDLLQQAGVVATQSSSNEAKKDVHHVRIAVSIINSDAEIDRALDAIASLP